MNELALQVEIDYDEMLVQARVLYRIPDTFISRESLDAHLKEKNILAGIDNDAINKAFAIIDEPRAPGDEEEVIDTIIEIARGKFAKKGKDGKVNFKVNVSGHAVYTGAEETSSSTEEAEKTEDESGEAINFREATKVISVKPGDVIAEITPPTKGEDGVNLSGKPITARNGKAITIHAGEGVEVDSTGCVFTANAEGRPIYSGGIIKVSPVYEVSENVDYSTGNIKFNGHVFIRGNVLDDFKVEANSVEIGGVVGASEIRCKGDLSVYGGINGKEKGYIEVGGNLFAKYLTQVEKTIVKKDVRISRELVNTVLWCQGAVKAAVIVGGECLALQGIETKVAGSDLGITTILEPGSNYEMRDLDLKIKTIEDKIEELLRPVSIFFGERARFKSLPEDKKQEFVQSFENFKKLKEVFKQLCAKHDELTQKEDYQPVKEVKVWKKLFSDVFIRTDLCRRQFKTELTGPLILVEDVERGTIRPANVTSKDEKAHKAENAEA